MTVDVKSHSLTHQRQKREVTGVKCMQNIRQYLSLVLPFPLSDLSGKLTVDLIASLML